MRSLCIYEWKSWHGFLLPMIAPEATRVGARFGETSSELLKRLPADVSTFAFHVNLTDTRRTPLRRRSFSRALRARGIRILNEHVTDISKHRVQAVCASAGLHTTKAAREGDPGEMLIVKTNANYGGEKEDLLTPEQRRTLGLGGRCRWIRGHDSYLIRPRREIRDELWRSAQIIVERFIENRHHAYYRAYKLLDSVFISRVVNRAQIKKMLPRIPRTNWYVHLPAHEAMRGPEPMPLHVARAVSHFCTGARLDFGTIDVMEDDDGECYVVDVNASPYMGETENGHILRFLGDAL